MKTVKEVSNLTGISIRTLHHYDAIGLLPPTQVTEAGYRLYDDEALRRLQTILLFRQLRFPLKQIREILASPDFDPTQALDQQIRLLELQRQQLDRLIDYAKTIQKTGGITMDFTAFDTSELDAYTARAKEKWGHTNAWREYTEKTAGQTNQQLANTGNDLMDIFREFGTLLGTSPASPHAQELTAKLQRFITDHYYHCTDQILKGLGQMYIAGDAMTENIEKAGGPGTAQFVYDAIEVYCK